MLFILLTTLDFSSFCVKGPKDTEKSSIKKDHDHMYSRMCVGGMKEVHEFFRNSRGLTKECSLKIFEGVGSKSQLLRSKKGDTFHLRFQTEHLVTIMIVYYGKPRVSRIFKRFKCHR